jgi:hypothetical protein
LIQLRTLVPATWHLQRADIVAKVGEERLGRNNRIGRSKFLNQPCVSRADLESMLLRRTPKIFLQQYRPKPAVKSPSPLIGSGVVFSPA